MKELHLTPEAASSSSRFISYGARRSLLLAGLTFSALLAIMTPLTVNHGLHITLNHAWADSEGGDGNAGDGGEGGGDHSDSNDGDHGDDNGDNGDDNGDNGDDDGDNNDDNGDNNDDNQDGGDTADEQPGDAPPPAPTGQ